MKIMEMLMQSAFEELEHAVVITGANPSACHVLVEGKWLSAKFDRDIRVDRNTHLRSNEMHAHIYDRKGNLLGAVTQAGQRSHKCAPFTLDAKQANALRDMGFEIPKSNIVEVAWENDTRQLLLG